MSIHANHNNNKNKNKKKNTKIITIRTYIKI